MKSVLNVKGGWFQTEAKSPARHYFDWDNLSLCRTWVSSDMHRLRGSAESQDKANCPLCQTELDKRKAKEARREEELFGAKQGEVK